MADEEVNPFASWKDPVNVVKARRASFRQIAEIRRRVELSITGVFNTTNFQDDAAVDRMVTELIKLVNAGQLQVANITSVYLAGLMSIQTGKRVKPMPVDRKQITEVRKVDPRVQYRRTAVTIYTALKAGKSIDMAKKMALKRLITMAMTDIQLSKVKQSSHSMVSAKVTRYRRTLSGSENCRICELAATQRYWSKDLAPIHDSCDCGVEPLPQGFPGGQVIDPEGLADIKKKVEDFHVAEGGTVTLKNGTTRPATFRDLTFNRNDERGLTIGWANREYTTL